MFDKPFQQKKVAFNNQLVLGFMASTIEQKSQILIN
jgi:hypothetical protein